MMERIGRWVLWSLLMWSVQASAQKLILSTFDYESPIMEGVATLMQGLYEAEGLSFEVRRLPGRRSLMEANSGRVDGELVRIALPRSEFPHLVPVPEPLLTIHVGAWGFHPGISRVKSWNDLKGMRVAALRGMLLAEANLDGEVIWSSTVRSLFGMLDRQRVDAIILPDEIVAMAVRRQGVMPGEMYRSATLASFDVYHYLNERHAALAERLAKRIRELKSTGEWQKRLEGLLDVNIREGSAETLPE